MSYGVELINNNNYRVATENDVNYVLVASGRMPDHMFRGYDGANTARRCMINTDGLNAPLLFMQCDSADRRVSQIPGCRGLNYTNGQWVTQKTIDVYKWHNKNVGELQYFLFDRWIPPERSSYGMQIFDGGGGIIFDSGWHFLKIREVIWLDPGYPNHVNSAVEGANWTFVGNYGNAGNTAVAMPYAREWTVYNGIYSYRTNECVHHDPNGNLFTSLMLTGEYLDIYPFSGWVHKMRSQIMICDVSGLPRDYRSRELIAG